MADIAIFRINYKSDFILTLNSDAGWETPFCIKFWTGAPSQAYFVGYDGTTYTHCAPVDGEPTKLRVQFDDHHLPIGDLKFQIGYHFTVEDFPTSVEDEVLNQASVIIEQDGEPAQVMLDFNGETAPEIEFSLPAYENEAQRIDNEQQRIENEQARISAENERISNEDARIAEEQVRVSQESARVSEFAQLKEESQVATVDANAAAELANEKAALAQQKATNAQTQGDYAKAQGDYAKAQGDYAKAQGDYAKAQGDYAKAQGDTALADHERAETDHSKAASDHTQAAEDHARAESDHEAVEVYVDSLGAFDISAYHATGGVLAKYADLTAALGAGGANIPDTLRKGGMSVKFVQSSDNEYIQYMYMGPSVIATIFTNVNNWIKCEDVAKGIAEFGFTPTVSLSPYLISSGWKLTSDGLSLADDSYNIIKYTVTEGDVLKLNLSKDGDGVMQFQNAVNIPASYTNENLIGFPYTNAVNEMVKVPIGATYLMVSQLKTNTTNVVNKMVGVDVNPTFESKNLVESGSLANLFKGILFNTGYLDTNGNVTDVGNDRYSHSDYLIAKEGMIINGVKPSSSSPHPCLWFYDEYCRFLSTYNAQSGTSTNITLTAAMIPQGAKYVRFNIYNEDFNGLFNFSRNDGDTIPYSILKYSIGTILIAATVEYSSSGIRFGVGDIYCRTNNGIYQQMCFDSLELTISAWSNIVYSVSTNSVLVKTFSQIEPSDIVLAAFDANKHIFPNTPLFSILRKDETINIVYSAQIDLNVDTLAFRVGDLYISFPNKTYKAHYFSNEQSFAVAQSGFQYIVYDLSTDTLKSITTFSGLGAEIITLLVLNNGKAINGIMLPYVVNNPLRFKVGYIDWDSGDYQANDKRLYSKKMKFDHDVYVGFKHPIINTVNGNTLQYRIYLYDSNNNYIGLYVDPSNYWNSKTSYNIQNILIPKDTIFAIVLKYSNETVTPEYSLEYILRHTVFGISETPLYYELPSYYLNGVKNEDGLCVQYLTEKIKYVESLINDCAADGDIFINIADIHFERNQQHSPALIKYITDRVKIERLFNVGDDYDGNGLDIYRIYKGAIKNGKLLFAAGNHDAPEYGTTPAYPLQNYNVLSETHFDTQDESIHYGNYKYGYYYTDNAAKKIRYIVLNSIGDQTANLKPYDDDQMNWFENVALNVESGWTILIFTHIFLNRTGDPLNYEYAINSYALSQVIPILNRYNGNGTIAAIFAGDDHADRMAYVSNKNIPVILTMTDGNARLDASEKPRTTIYEQAFDVVVLDKTNRKLTMVRIGALAWNGVGLTNRGTQAEYREITY